MKDLSSIGSCRDWQIDFYCLADGAALIRPTWIIQLRHSNPKPQKPLSYLTTQMPNYRRYHIPGGCYFFTVNLLDRKQTLLVDRIDLLRESIKISKQKHPFHIDAWVVLPDHLHCVWTLPPGDSNFSRRWKAIKTYFSKQLPIEERRSKVRIRRSERGIWQRRFWEHAIRDNRDYAAYIDYIHFNPVKHGLVARVVDWPYSTFHRYVENGVIASDWAGGSEMIENVGERGDSICL